MSVLYVHVLCTVGFLLINRFCNIQRGKLKASDPEIETLWNFPSTHTLGLPTCVEFHSIIPFLQLNFLPFRFTNPVQFTLKRRKKVSENALHLYMQTDTEPYELNQFHFHKQHKKKFAACTRYTIEKKKRYERDVCERGNKFD